MGPVDSFRRRFAQSRGRIKETVYEDSYSLTDVGMVRQVNQDYVYTSRQTGLGHLPNLFVVADGMGGHQCRRLCFEIYGGSAGERTEDARTEKMWSVHLIAGNQDCQPGDSSGKPERMNI